MFFVHGRRFNGFHCRFRDIARGGMRIVTPQTSEQVCTFVVTPYFCSLSARRGRALPATLRLIASGEGSSQRVTLEGVFFGVWQLRVFWQPIQ